MAIFAVLRDPVTLTLDFERSMLAYCVDTFSLSMGVLMGTSTVMAVIEGAIGISGARPVSHAFHCSGWLQGNLISVFFSIFASINYSFLSYWWCSRDPWHIHDAKRARDRLVLGHWRCHLGVLHYPLTYQSAPFVEEKTNFEHSSITYGGISGILSSTLLDTVLAPLFGHPSVGHPELLAHFLFNCY